jgi:hypothetical protein
MSWALVRGAFPLFATVAQENDPDLACMVRLREGDDLALNELMERWQSLYIRSSCDMSGTTET